MGTVNPEVLLGQSDCGLRPCFLASPRVEIIPQNLSCHGLEQKDIQRAKKPQTTIQQIQPPARTLSQGLKILYRYNRYGQQYES